MKVVGICKESSLDQGYRGSFFLFCLCAGCLRSRSVLYCVQGLLLQDMPEHDDSVTWWQNGRRLCGYPGGCGAEERLLFGWEEKNLFHNFASRLSCWTSRTVAAPNSPQPPSVGPLP